MPISYESQTTQDFERATRLEWLETNGLGGWASSTVCGAHTRRYHGLLVAATHPPAGRMVLLSRLDETIHLGDKHVELSCNQFPSAIHPQGFRYLDRFEKDFFPVFDYSVDGVQLRKTVVAINGENTTLVLYEVRRAPRAFSLQLTPFVAARNFHSLSHANEDISDRAYFRAGILKVQPYQGTPAIFLFVPGASFQLRPNWYRNFQYALEQFRGLDFQEDLFTYGSFQLVLRAGDRLAIIISTQDPSNRDAWELYGSEKKRRQDLLDRLPVRDDLTETLALAADQFVVRRGESLRSIIAGYHWFADWGRDTMISLPGLALVTGRYGVAKKILKMFAQSVSQGMLPNRFPEVGQEPEYNAVDATLWFFVAIYKYWQYTSDHSFIREELLDVLAEIIEWHDSGTRHNIHVEEDGLLYAGESGLQLTWMDARIGDWVVTPRRGKPVEVNALWYNALRIFALFLKKYAGSGAQSEEVERRALKVRTRFLETFWDESLGYLYDYVAGEYRDASVRPNQLLALSLPFPILPKGQAQSMLEIVERKLYTPVGLRSLAPEHPAFRAHYAGDHYSRDSAYHQGTVWSWFLGPYVTALKRFGGAEGSVKAGRVIELFSDHLHDAGVGTVSEIFDATPPYAPRGAIAQAWSVAEILRAYLEEIQKRALHRALGPGMDEIPEESDATS